MAAILASLMTWLDTFAAGAVSEAATGAADTDKMEQPTPAGPANETHPAGEAPRAASLFIQEYQVKGAHLLSRIEIEEAVYPFLGPGRTKDDVEQARVALETAYHDKGYQTVTVEIPPQQVRGGIVLLHVIEAPVARLRVKGAHYFSPAQIKAQAPSLAEGRVINFNEVPTDIVALNQLPDRQVTPTLSAGAQPGTVDVDLTVKDSPPLHGSLELNNRYSANTTALRLNGSVSDSNLWQLGHTLGLSFQVSPENFNQVKVFSGYYLVHAQSVEGLSLMLQGTKQDSNVSTLGGAAVAGRGETLGARALLTLPAGKSFYHSLSLGLDYKHFDQDIMIGASEIVTPITYYPLSASYSATWLGQGQTTALNAGVTLHLRGTGSSTSTFDAKRFKADGGFIYFRGDLSHTHDLPAGLQLFGKVQGQISDEPLIDSEEFSGGGLDTARGYLEAEEIGDNGLFGSLELRSPSLLGWFGQAKAGEWRVYAFGDAGRLTINDPLPEQASRFDLASFGAGTRIRLEDHFSGSIDAALPLTSQSQTKAHDLRLTFRAGLDY
ncbi:MAG TPA: ShlB/FhaC/HecB family hemolysin secretion/activation protein [Opitutaceae bacterium]|nr:ShlB/FhaC/HecB family hemolysin secretion/activation protein [Opitutaceae bacterium]